MAKIDTQFMTKTAEKPYPLGRTYLYSPYKGIPPGYKAFWGRLKSDTVGVTCCWARFLGAGGEATKFSRPQTKSLV